MRKSMILGIVLLLVAVAVTVMSQQAPSVAAPAAAPAPAAAAAPAPSLTITRMEFCGSVMDRKPVDVSTTFMAAQDSVTCYLEFKDVKKETTVNVVWTLGQNEMRRIPLTIKPFPKFRTWANKSINGMTGDWKVDVVDDNGAILQTASFKVQ